MQIGVKAALLGLCMCATTSLCAAQSLGDLARQERARRAQQTRHAPVITNEDLKRDHIIPPPPAAVPEAPSAASLPVSTHPTPDVPLWKVAEQPGFSLGTYARQLRKEKKEREAERNAKAAPHVEPDRGASPLVRSVTRPELADLPIVVQRPSASPAAKSVAIRERKPLAAAPRVARTVHVAPAHHSKAAVRNAPRRHVVRTQEPDPSRVVVQPGDSLWRIAEDVFGDGRLWTTLWHANPGIRNPNRIYAGQTLRMPAAVQVATAKSKWQKAAARAAVSSQHRFATAQPNAVPAFSGRAASLEPAPADLPRQ